MNFKKEHFVIAIDGLSGSGKSSTAKALASRLQINYLNTGLMYRMVTYFAQEKQILPSQQDELKSLIQNLHFSFENPHFLIQNQTFEQLTGHPLEILHSPKISEQVSEYSAASQVRKLLVGFQQKFIQKASCIVEGRDISTVVYPQAQCKYYLWASAEIRSQRRTEQLKNQKQNTNYQKSLNQLLHRDRLDSSREIAPLVQADDADLIDTSHLNFDEQVQLILDDVVQKSKESINKTY